MDNSTENVINFAAQKPKAKSPTQETVKLLVRQVNRHKLSYDSLKHIFAEVRKKCGVEVPREKKKLLELPKVSELSQYFSVIESPTHRLIFETLHGTGLRVSELANLKVAQIDFEANCLLVINGKGGKDRVAVIGSRLVEKLKIYLDGRQNQYLFESRYNTKFSSRRIQQLCQTYRAKAELECELTCHTFRHLWNTALANKGVSREIRALLAGHSDLKTQDIYTHLSVGGLKPKVMEVLDEL